MARHAAAAGEHGGMPGGNGGRRVPARDRVFDELCHWLLTGRIVPGRGVTLRGLAAELGVSPMPVREAIHRLAAEQALEIGPTGRIHVPAMSAARFEEIVRVRVLLEPEIAARALPHVDKALLATLKAIDAGIDRSLETGDVESYMQLNHDFHFGIYGAASSDVMLPLIESIWLQFGPFMRTVYGRVGTSHMIDQHELALAAIAAGDVEGLKGAIAGDILDGMQLLGLAIVGEESAAADGGGARPFDNP
ncbi:MAG: GntR family transcriptional regulator [Hyphomicrobiales bacterium]